VHVDILPCDVAAQKTQGLLMAERAIERDLGQPLDQAVAEPLEPRSDRPAPSLSLVASEEQRLFVRVAPVVNGLVWSMLGPDSEREDIAHEAFIRIFRARSSLRNVDAVEAWAASITVNTVKNELRRRRLRRWVPFDFWGEGQALRSYVEDISGRELLKAAFRVLERLPTDERVALSLRLFQGIEIDEIARLTQCSPRTAKRRLSAARERFELLASRDSLLAGWLSAQKPEQDYG
jgi:RNA polymerase sigma-70 factor (ECF subfamily)